MLVYELANVRKTLDSVSNYQGIDFAYAVFKNKQLIDNKLMEMDFIKNVSPEIIEYEEKRIKICDQYSKKDSNGLPIIENDLYLIDESDKEDFKYKMDELLNQYKVPVEYRQNQIELFNQKMNSTVNIDFIKIKKEQIPSQISTAKELENISFMIE